MKYIFLFLIINITCLAQTVEVKYFENSKAPSQEQFNLMPKNVQIAYKANVFSYKLNTDGKSSLYKNEKIIIDSAGQISTSTEVNEAGDTIKKTIISEVFNAKFKEKSLYKDFLKNKSYNTQYYDETINIVDSISQWKWQLIDETETVIGYACKKAVTKHYGNEIIAWFTDEIPISDGPFVYCGLPGLILKVETKSNEIIAYNVLFKNDPLTISPPFLSGKIFNYKTLKEYIENKNKERSRFR
jgi:GLPGLI family protein